MKPFYDLGKPFYDLGKPFYDLGKPFYDLGKPFYDLGKPFLIIIYHFIFNNKTNVAIINSFILYLYYLCSIFNEMRNEVPTFGCEVQ